MTELSPIEIRIPGQCANLQVTEFLTLRTGWALVSPGVSIGCWEHRKTYVRPRRGREQER